MSYFQYRILQYSAEFIKSLQPKATHLNHKIRKFLFKYNIWKPRHSPPRSLVTCDLYNTVDHPAVLPARSRCVVTQVSEGAGTYQPAVSKISIVNCTQHGLTLVGVTSDPADNSPMTIPILIRQCLSTIRGPWVTSCNSQSSTIFHR